LSSPQATKIEVKTSSSSKAALRLVAGGESRTFGPILVPPGRSGAIVEKLEAGEYYVFARRESAGTADLTIEVSTSASAVEPQVPGEVVKRIEDWQVGVGKLADKKLCFAFTVAKTVSPDGWRVELPMMYLQISPGDDGVYTSLDKVKHYDKAQKFKAMARGGGINQAIGAMVEGDFDIKPTEPCAKKPGSCIMESTVKAMNRADEIVLEGKTSDRKSAYVRYSLHGYKGAVQEMNRLCDNTKRTGWLVPQ
jgi:hypothetical protein